MSTPSPGAPEQIRALTVAGRFAEALEAFRAREPALAGRPDLALLAATAAMRLGDVEEAGRLAQRALDGFRTRADLDGRMRALNLLGVIAFEQGRPAEAERAWGEALRLALELKDTLLAARASNNLASVTHLRGRHTDALSLYRGALLSYQRLGDRRGAAETYHNLGLVFRQLSDWYEAEGAATEAVRHATMVGEGGLLALAMTGQAEMWVERGELALAGRQLERAVRLADEARDEIGIAEALRVRALAKLRRGDAAEALEQAEAARALADRLGVALLRAEAAAATALALRQLGRTEEAEARRTEALSGYRALGATLLESRLEREWSREVRPPRRQDPPSR